MRIAIEIMGRKFELEIRGLRRVYINTTKHAFALCRDEWFVGKDGRWQRWALERV